MAADPRCAATAARSVGFFCHPVMRHGSRDLTKTAHAPLRRSPAFLFPGSQLPNTTALAASGRTAGAARLCDGAQPHPPVCGVTTDARSTARLTRREGGSGRRGRATRPLPRAGWLDGVDAREFICRAANAREHGPMIMPDDSHTNEHHPSPISGHKPAMAVRGQPPASSKKAAGSCEPRQF